MIQLLCKKRFRFRNPNATMIKQETVGVGADKKQLQVQSGAKFEEAYFEVVPDRLTACPDWVKTDIMFSWGVKEGSIIEVATKSESLADAVRQQDDERREKENKETQEQKEELKERLHKMTKVELLKYASDTHELELSTGMTKDAILEAIATAEKESSEEA
jgi:hypothetical protein